MFTLSDKSRRMAVLGIFGFIFLAVAITAIPQEKALSNDLEPLPTPTFTPTPDIILNDATTCNSIGGIWDDGSSTCQVSNLTLGSGLALIVDSGVTLETSGEVTFNFTQLNNIGTIENNGTITNNGFIGNDGTINNNGTIENQGTIDNRGIINNFGTIISDCSAVFTGNEVIGNPIIGCEEVEIIVGDENSCSILDGTWDTDTNTCQVADLMIGGDFENVTLVIESGVTLETSGVVSITKFSRILNNGTLRNLGTINNSGRIEGGIFDNVGTINNIGMGTFISGFDHIAYIDFSGTNSGTINIIANLVTVSLDQATAHLGPGRYFDAFIDFSGTSTNLGTIVISSGSIAIGTFDTGATLDNSGSITINSPGALFVHRTLYNNGLIENLDLISGDGEIVNNSVIKNICSGDINSTITGNPALDEPCVPVADDDAYNTPEDTMLSVAAPGVLDGDTDPGNDPLTAVLDTDTSNGTLALNGDGAFSYTPDPDFCGADSFTYHANNGQADSNIAVVSINVSCVNDAPSVNDGDLELGSVSIDENDTANLSGVFADPDTGDAHTVTIDWGDGTANTVVSLSGEERSFSASHQYLDDNPSATSSDPYLITVTVEDAASSSDSAATTITVKNVEPVVGPITAPQTPVSINDQPVNVSAAFTDTSPLDTHTAFWDWGDGTSTAGDVSETNGSGSVTGEHTYDIPGVYEVTLTVEDDDTGTGQSVFQYIVIFDPTGGFVTGGGWIDSPLGAYMPDPTLTGKASFGFVSKYKKGTNDLTGHTEFQFKVADLKFHSNDYDWLVVAGANAKFKGTGTINGEGEYGFIITGTDAKQSSSLEVDSFRIKIWNKASDTMIYDNQMGESDDSNAGTEIGGGNIVVH